MSKRKQDAAPLPASYEQLIGVLFDRLTRTVGVNPDEELTIAEAARIIRIGANALKLRMKENAIWRAAFYKVGKKDLRTTRRRIWAAQDKLSLLKSTIRNTDHATL